MRTFTLGLASITLAVATFGCASNGGTKSGAQPNTPSAKAGATKPCVMQAGGHDILRLTVSADATCTPKDGSLKLESHDNHVYIWLVPAAKTVDDAVTRIDQTIKPEFKEFRASSTTALTIAGSPAKRLTGPGTEADDGDPGDADLILFNVGNHVFIACVHGESISAAARQWLLTVVLTAQMP